MKSHIIFTSLILAALANPSIAQTLTDKFDFGLDLYRNNISFPKEFAYNEVPYLVLYDKADQNSIQIYDKDLQMVKRITMKESIPFNYQLTYQDQVRKVTVNETQKEERQKYDSYEAFIEQAKQDYTNFDESRLIITNLDDGTKKIFVDGGVFNQSICFAYKYFGTKYPKIYYIDDGTTVTLYRAAYTAQYSDWETTATRVVDYTTKQNRMRLGYINLNLDAYRSTNYFEVSQTLFNDDASFEYLMPKYKLSANGFNLNHEVIEEEDYGNKEEKIITEQTVLISERKGLAIEGFQVLSENGEVISDITFDDDFEGCCYKYTFVITIGSNTYLAFEGMRNGKEGTIFYKIDRKNPSAIQKVKVALSTMSLSQTVAGSNSTIRVNFGDANEKGSDIVVVSASGGAIQSYHVPAGQTSAQIQTNASTGVYCVNRLSKNKVVESKKIIIK